MVKTSLHTPPTMHKCQIEVQLTIAVLEESMFIRTSKLLAREIVAAKDTNGRISWVNLNPVYHSILVWMAIAAAKANGLKHSTTSIKEALFTFLSIFSMESLKEPSLPSWSQRRTTGWTALEITITQDQPGKGVKPPTTSTTMPHSLQPSHCSHPLLLHIHTCQAAMSSWKTNRPIPTNLSRRNHRESSTSEGTLTPSDLPNTQKHTWGNVRTLQTLESSFIKDSIECENLWKEAPEEACS